LATNTTDSQAPIGREAVGTDSVRYRRPDRPRLREERQISVARALR